MVRSQFFWKLYASYVVLVILAVATVGVLVGRSITRESLDEVERSLRVRAVLLRDVAARSTEEPDSLQARVVALGAAVQTRLTVIAADGTVIADSDQDPSSMDNHGTRPEVIAAAAEGSGTSTRFSRTVASSMMYHALAVRNGDVLLGYVRSSLPLTVVEQRQNDLWWLILSAGFFVTLIAMLLGLFVTRRVTAPLVRMTGVAEAIAGGMFSERVDSHSRDEIGKLSSAFNRMAAELEERIATITEDRGKLLTVLSGMVEGVVAVDHQLRILHLNASAERILGVDASTSIGKPVWEVTRLLKVNETIEQALRELKEVTNEICLQQDSKDRIVELHAAPLRNGQTEPNGVVLVLHEVTELRRLETVRQDFVANVSHELKTPITAIRGLVETVLDDDEMTAETRTRFLHKAQDQSMRLSRLVSDLLTLSRLESHDAVRHNEVLELRDLVEASVSNFQPTAEVKQVSLSVQMPELPVRVLGDWDALELVFNNLLDNALKYTPASGTISVGVRSEDDEVIVEIEDSGTGISSEHHDRIFERFYRVDKARSRELGGTGLGLSIVKHICKVHGGTVVVRSTPGTGSTFTVRLPLSAQSAATEKFTDS